MITGFEYFVAIRAGKPAPSYTDGWAYFRDGIPLNGFQQFSAGNPFRER